MAFSFSCTKTDLEFRAMEHGVSQKGNEWISLIFEDSEAKQLSISVPENLRYDVLALHLSKGTVCAVTFRAVASAKGNSFLQLLGIPVPFDDEDEDEE